MKYKVKLSTKVSHKKLKEGSGILVIEPDDYSDSEIKSIKKKKYKPLLAYLSIGTLEKERSWFEKYKKLRLQRLEDWPNEWYVDVSDPKWQKFILKRAKDLISRGFDGFWCDNLDVYSEYKSDKMFSGCKAVLEQIKALGGYVMVNGGSEWIDDALDKKINVSKIIDGYTQEEVFSLIKKYSGKGKFGKQKSSESKYYKKMIKRAIQNGIGGFLLEYTRSKSLKAKIRKWCSDNNASCCISEDVNL